MHSTRISFKTSPNLLHGEAHRKDCFHAKNTHVVYSSVTRGLVRNVTCLHKAVREMPRPLKSGVGSETGWYQLGSNAALKLQPGAGVNIALPVALGQSLCKATKPAETFLRLPALLRALPGAAAALLSNGGVCLGLAL